MNMQEFRCGLKDGAPIAAGYLSVSFSFGIMVLGGGLSIFQGALMSLTNMTSAGQFAGLQVIIAGGTLLEMAVTQFIINLRYALMSLSLSQKLSDAVTFRERLVIAFANTDEIFAVAVGRGKSLTFSYMLGLQLLPVLGWTSGTVLGAAASGLMPPAIAEYAQSSTAAVIMNPVNRINNFTSSLIFIHRSRQEPSSPSSRPHLYGRALFGIPRKE